jgi:aerobic-type carbon monoxide dehydrogenase small subunit (CoxS/CutS family)
MLNIYSIKWTNFENNNLSTKVACKEGGCGACVINVEIKDLQTNTSKFVSINTVSFRIILLRFGFDSYF